MLRKDPSASSLLNKSAVLTVGDGRGFVVQGSDNRFVVTAAHCLPFLPPAHLASYDEERTYGCLLGPLHAAGSVAAECVFVDPVGDIAVLGSPDEQELAEFAAAYEGLVGSCLPLEVADLPETTVRSSRSVGPVEIREIEATGWLLSLEGEWFECVVQSMSRIRTGTNPQQKDGLLSVSEAIVKGGMSGSPILSDEGRAIGVISTGSRNARLTNDLPGWLLRELGAPWEHPGSPSANWQQVEQRRKGPR